MKAFEYLPKYEKTVLASGVRVVTEHHPQSRATSVGIFVDQGTRDEPEHMVGAAHFVEHMVFKGTKSRSAFEIAKSLESVGGDLNAYTSREYTCYHGTTLKENTDLSFEILADLILNATMKSVDFVKEREVILQEIDMSTDLLEEYIFDKYFEDVYHGHSLGRSILGTPQSLNGIKRKDLFDFYKHRYSGSKIIVAAAGHVNHDEIVKLAEKAFGRLKSKEKFPARRAPKIKPFREVYKKPSEQTHVLLGLPSTSYKDNLRFEAYILNAVFGGGMTSRLYQNIREELGLAYSVYSYLHSYSDTGLLMLYAASSSKNYPKVIEVFLKELEKIRKRGISRKELDFFKRQVTGSIILAADDIENRMNSLGVNEMIFKKYRPVDVVLADISQISKESVQEYIDQYLDPAHMGISIMGDVDRSLAEQYLSLC
ncbi:MAG: insulinase family protein [Bdellovibrionales bacterium]|nr:insulinase family protein [Bdellovibrionales bacterium]